MNFMAKGSMYERRKISPGSPEYSFCLQHRFWRLYLVSVLGKTLFGSKTAHDPKVLWARQVQAIVRMHGTLA